MSEEANGSLVKHNHSYRKVSFVTETLLEVILPPFALSRVATAPNNGLVKCNVENEVSSFIERTELFNGWVDECRFWGGLGID